MPCFNQLLRVVSWVEPVICIGENMNQLNKMINHAYKNSFLYQQMKPNVPIEDETFEILNLPIIQKKDMFGSTPVETIEYLFGRIPEEDVFHMSTSGSTGICLPILWHKNDYIRSMMPLWMLRKKFYNINPHDKVCYFYTMREGGDTDLAYDYKDQTLGFSKCGLDENRIYEIYQKMLEYGPKWMMLQPSIVELLLESAKKHGFPPIKELEYIEFSGEILFDDLRERVKEFFGCKVSNQYGSYEFNSIAFECSHGNMHCVGSNVYVEIIDDDDKIISDDREGDIIVTSLNNQIMPFIRYRIGDRGRLRRGLTCDCGNHNPILELTVGRSNDYITTAQGRNINPYIMVRAVENINNFLDGVIKQFKIIQKDYELFQVHLRIDDVSVKEELEEMFKHLVLEPELENAKYEFIYSNSFINDDGRKLRYFINDVERN